MSLSGKVEKEVEIQAPAAKFYNLFRKQLHQIPDISERVHGAKILEGYWESVGSIKHWNYTLEGKATSAKQKIESIDDENKAIAYSLFDEEVSENYKSLRAILQVFDKDNGGIVKWTIEYEKLEENISGSPPDAYLEFISNVTKEIDAHFSKE